MSNKSTIYAVDFDGTLCESEFPGIGAPNTFLISHLIKRRNQGNKIILWTCRCGKRLQEAVEWCKQHGLEFDAINENLPETVEWFGGTESRKIHADVFIDDKAVNKPKYHVPYKELRSVQCDMNQLDYLKQKMTSIVNQCLVKHGGGESYFDELDSLIRRDIELIITYLKYAIERENVHDVVVSGEIGLILSKLISKKIIPVNVNFISINGGLRKGKEPVGTNIPLCESFKAIFFDDSYYSGKTARAVSGYIQKYGGSIVKNYVFYDGCPDRHEDVVSLYRYYK